MDCDSVKIWLHEKKLYHSMLLSTVMKMYGFGVAVLLAYMLHLLCSKSTIYPQKRIVILWKFCPTKKTLYHGDKNALF